MDRCKKLTKIIKLCQISWSCFPSKFSLLNPFRYLYKCARGSEWGDRLPVKWPCKRLEDPEGSSASNPVKEKHNLTRSELQQGDLSVETDSTSNSSDEKVTQPDPSQTKTHLDFVQVVK